MAKEMSQNTTKAMIKEIFKKIFNRRKKVLVDLCQLDFPNCGFGQIAINYAHYFAEIQKAKTEEFDICFLLPDFMKGSPIPGVKCYYENLNADTSSKEKWYKRMFSKEEINVDVWHSVNQLCRVYPTQPKTKLIFTIHDYNFLTEESAEQIKIRLKTMQDYIDRATAVTFISNYTAKCVKENSCLDGKIIRTIYNGVEPLVNKENQRPPFVNDNKEFFFAIGVFFPKKRFHVLLDVMKHFPEKMLYICGNTDAFGSTYGKEIKERIRNENITNVIVPGPIEEEHRVWLFANCQAYLFPSVGEGFGLPAIEAMQFGKPVFVSNAQCLPEIVGNYGYIWKSFDIQDMVETVKQGIEEFYSNPCYAEKAKKYAATFSYQRHISDYLSLYRELTCKN